MTFGFGGDCCWHTAPNKTGIALMNFNHTGFYIQPVTEVRHPMWYNIYIRQQRYCKTWLTRNCLNRNVIQMITVTTRTIRAHTFRGYPRRPMINHIIDQFILDPKSKQDKVNVTNLKNLPKLQILEFCKKNLYARHTFWSCLIRCVNMKWSWRVL